MNEGNLYYRRGIYIIDKLLNLFSNDSSFYKKRMELEKAELHRMSVNKELMVKDVNSLCITAVVALCGLNKENIENLNKHEDYDLYEPTDEEKRTTNLDQLKKFNPEFDRSRKLVTKFDDWLSVENCDHPTLSYMMNIRNALLHSEYECFDEYGDILSISNSNYTHFKAKIALYGMINFCLFYFGNNTWTGLTENFNMYGLDNSDKIVSLDQISEVLKKIEIVKVNYSIKGKKRGAKLPELNAYKIIEESQTKPMDLNKLLDKIFTNKYEYTTQLSNLTEEQINIIVKMIEKYYGNKFYELDNKSQNIQLQALTRYLIDNRSVLSEWICDYIYLYGTTMNFILSAKDKYRLDIEKIIDQNTEEENKRSVFACRTSLMILKLYHVLYRLQNKNYEEINYEEIDFDVKATDYNYCRTDMDGSKTYDFEIDKTKFKLKDDTLTEKELQNKVVCDIIRNSLSHGNIEMNFKIENSELKEYVVFEDEYHSKNRRLEISIDKLDAFLKSQAFDTKKCLVKEEKICKK